ncbi:MAG: hypothetical protein A2010_04900 [Nitrospirae bacterium GWD2_57_9]|nr:MAG: hypothetical protein A2010_04900 [Nitrospirae bacterium GWD2_57_9]OGW45093.1 MAG: hypothetical protein A2078_14365 [Nitrospirae bacterium GWC2_57_9]
MRKLLVILFMAVGIAACASSHAPVQPPLRDADLYPGAQTEAGLSIAVDEIRDPDRVRHYFGSDLTRDGILPVNVVISNRGEDEFLVRPPDILATEGSSVIDAVPVEKVVREGTKTALQETIVRPGDSYQGFLFYKVRKREGGIYGKVEKIFSDRMNLRMVVTDRTSGERIHFGPFPLSGL